MLNRRKALLTGTASLLAAGAVKLPTLDAQPRHSDTDCDSKSVAELCIQCSAECAMLTARQNPAGQAAAADLKALAADCAEVCNVTATLLSRQGPLAPAICQACADACSRVARAATTGDTASLRAIARRCAVGCQRMVRKV